MGEAVKLIDDWKQKFPKLWSVRLSLLAALASAIEAGFTYYAHGKPGTFAIIAGLISLGAAVARIVAQPKLDG